MSDTTPVLSPVGTCIQVRQRYTPFEYFGNKETKRASQREYGADRSFDVEIRPRVRKKRTSAGQPVFKRITEVCPILPFSLHELRLRSTGTDSMIEPPSSARRPEPLQKQQKFSRALKLNQGDLQSQSPIFQRDINVNR